MVTNAQLLRMYRKYNRLYFGGKLPMDLPVKFMDMKDRAWGHAWRCDGVPEKIELDKELRQCRGFTSMVLLHEMVHVELPWGADHGPRFIARMKKLARQGAFDRWW